jgi:hypothetical protein
MRIGAALAFGFAVSLAAGSVACATEDAAPAAHPYHHHHHRYHRLPVVRDAARAPAPAAAAPAPQTAPFGLAWPHIAPYPDNKGDEDGLSEDEDDCNKGCIENGPAN